MAGKIAALILAGGKNKPEMRAACGGIENRSMVPLNGRPMLDYVVGAVRDALEGGSAGRILVAGDVPLPAGCVAVAGGASMIDTLLAGVAALTPDESRLLVVTADIPFLTRSALEDFLGQAQRVGDADFIYPIVPAARCTERFPEMRRTTLRVAEGTFTGGNIVLVDPVFLRRNEAVLRSAYAQRKNVVALANLLGPRVLIRLLFSRFRPQLLPIGLLEVAVGQVLGGALARAVITEYAEIGADVDRPADVAIAERMLKKYAAASLNVDASATLPL
jgi:molybdopterin-guanine dinucleotide biosynthesis protein A